MKRKNKYIYRSKISEAKFREFVKFFSLDLKAEKIADLTHLNRNTVNRYSRLLRERIAFFCDHECPFYPSDHYAHPSTPESQTDKNIRNIKDIVVGIVSRDKKIFTEIVSDCTGCQLEQLTSKRHPEEFIEITDALCRFHALIDPKFKQVYWVDGDRKRLECACNKENVIEPFKSFARKRLLKFNGVSPSTFVLHLKECEFRYNYKNTYQLMLKMCRERPLNYARPMNYALF